jgi:probable O-glycosylation ligase (exosortase A-associated)
MARIFLIGYALVVQVTTEERLRLVLVVIAFSLGFESAKQGWATLFLNPGGVNINHAQFFGDNNGTAVGMFMLVPILTSLARTSTHRWVKPIWRFVAIGVLYRGISTYSRGGFLSLIAMGVHYLFRSKVRPGAIVGIILAGWIIVPVLPQEFWDRMATINAPVDTESTDAAVTAESLSTQSRLHFWAVAEKMAEARPLYGVGMHVYNEVYDQYDFSGGAWGGKRSVHSSWFGIMAELGFGGLALFASFFVMFFLTCRRARKVAKKYRDDQELARIASYMTALEGSLLAFAVGGAFVTFQYNEMLWHLLFLNFAVKRMLDQAVLAKETRPVPTGIVMPAAATARSPLPSF